MGFIELFKVGLITVFWNFSTPFLSIMVYVCLLLGIVVQFLLLKKSRRRFLRKFLFVICAAGLLTCECIWHAIIGWDRFLVDCVYLLFVALLLGAVIAAVIPRIQRRGSLFEGAVSAAG